MESSYYGQNGGNVSFLDPKSSFFFNLCVRFFLKLYLMARIRNLFEVIILNFLKIRTPKMA